MSRKEFPAAQKRKKLLAWTGALVLIALITLGVFAKRGWLPHTDALTGKRTTWFGAPLAKNASSSWDPFAAPLPSPTPQLAKEYVYAGSRLLAVEDVNASAVPPADLAVWRPSSGTWYVLGGSGQTTYTWGMSGDIPVQGDFDGDGKTDFTIFRPSTGAWWVTRSSDNSTYTHSLGQSGDLPAPADYDGDGRSDLAVWRPSTGVWYIVGSTDGSMQFTYGTNGDKPIPADYDGDGKADVALWRDSNYTFYILPSTTGTSASASYGATGDLPVPADYDFGGESRIGHDRVHLPE